MAAPPNVPTTIGIHTREVVTTGANDGAGVWDGDTVAADVPVPVGSDVGLVDAPVDGDAVLEAVGIDVCEGDAVVVAVGCDVGEAVIDGVCVSDGDAVIDGV